MGEPAKEGGGEHGLGFRRRALVTAALLVGFYVLSLGTAAVLFGIVAVMWISPDVPQNIWVMIACVLTGGSILAAVRPRRLLFEEPGPRLEESDAPGLFALMREVAEEAGQRPPDDVYALAEVNASVTEHGRGERRRVLTIGLPLLQILTVPEVRAVIAHELGHYHGGDTRLGPWLYRTRATIGRTIEALEERESYLRRPFHWYGAFFLRRSAYMSRHQEFTADALAARIAGVEAQATCLRKVSTEGTLYEVYWAQEVVPVLADNRVPPLLEGFERFRSSRGGAELREEVAKHLGESSGDPYDSHPAYPERLAAFGGEAHADSEGAGEPALSLVADPAALEALVMSPSPEYEGEPLRSIAWDDVPGELIVPGWREVVEHHRAGLEGLHARELHGLAERLTQYGHGLAAEGEPALENDEARYRGGTVLSAAFAVALLDSGWELVTDLGDPIEFRRDGRSVEPWREMTALAEGELTAEEWERRVDELGVADLSLGPGADPAAAAPAPPAA